MRYSAWRRSRSWARRISAVWATFGSSPSAGFSRVHRPSAPSCHAWRLSASSVSKIVFSSACARWRLDRHDDLDAVVEVARHQVGAADQVVARVAGVEDEDAAVLEEAAEHAAHGDPLASTPGRSMQMLRATMSIFAPACVAAARSSSMIAGVGQRVHLQLDLGAFALPSAACATWRISATSRVRSASGATSSLRKRPGPPKPVR